MVRNYLDAFKKLGCNNIRVMDIRKREDAFKLEMLERPRDSVMFSGGNQLRLSLFSEELNFWKSSSIGT
ncbi:MAG: hypothetical protein U0X76_04025 [Bacteroidia bacterium]